MIDGGVAPDAAGAVAAAVNVTSVLANALAAEAETVTVGARVPWKTSHTPWLGRWAQARMSSRLSALILPSVRPSGPPWPAGRAPSPNANGVP